MKKSVCLSAWAGHIDRLRAKRSPLQGIDGRSSGCFEFPFIDASKHDMMWFITSHDK